MSPRPRGTTRVGAALSLSGRYAIQGRQAMRGLTLWLEDVNAGGGLRRDDLGLRTPVELTVLDDRGRADLASSLVERLIVEEAVDLLMGPYSSVLALAASRVARRHGKLLWNHGGATDALSGSPWVVSLPTPASRYFHGALAMARQELPELERVGLVYGERGTFGPAVARGAERFARSAGFELAFTAPYPPPEETDALLRRVGRERLDILLGAGSLEMDVRLARGLAGERLRPPLVALVAAGIEAFGEALGPQAEGFAGPSQWEPAVRYRPEVGPGSGELAERFRERFGREADYPAAQAYAAGLIAERCVELAGGLEGGALQSAARELAVTTFFGRFRLRPSGQQVGHEMVVVQWQGGRRVILWPPEARAP